ncbi:MAG: hypothetical protein IT347_13040 [Candidatus Eisenbacteria bacterium]|nr:hypothetical protein [Candidatus Eisenbacteria bacterium]
MPAAPAIPTRLALASALVLALAGVAVSATAPRSPASAPGARHSPAPAREALLTVPADVPPALLGGKLPASVAVRVHVTAAGLVDSARAGAGDARLRASAEAAARWWVFAPAAGGAAFEVRVPVAAAHDAVPLHPDVLAIARKAEARGDLPMALAAWVGALGRVGESPVVANEWAIREQVIAIAHRMSPPPHTPGEIAARARGARNRQLRTVARAEHGELVGLFDEALRGAPWWDEPYLWRAGSLAGCGRTAEALRSLRAYRLASTDSAGAAFAGRLIGRLAASDTVGVCEAIKTWRVVSEPVAR